MIKLQRFIDLYVGGILCNFLVFFKINTKVVSERILIVKLWAIGESVLTLPLIRELRKKFPNAQIDVLSRKRNYDVYAGNNDVNRVMILEDLSFLKRVRYYDFVFDCEPFLNISAIISFFLGKKVVGFSHGNRSKLYNFKVRYDDNKHVVQTYLDLLKPFFYTKSPKFLVKLVYSKKDEAYAESLFPKKKPVIGLCATAAESAHSRIWPKRNYADLADHLIEKQGASIIFVGSPNDFSYNQEIIDLMKHKAFNLAGKTSVKQLIALIERCDLFISNDTGPMHIAAAQRVKTIGLFCPNTPIRFAPYGPKNVSIYKPIRKVPCINVHLGTIPDCKNHNHMSNIEVKDILRETDRLIKSVGSKRL